EEGRPFSKCVLEKRRQPDHPASLRSHPSSRGGESQKTQPARKRPVSCSRQIEVDKTSLGINRCQADANPIADVHVTRSCIDLSLDLRMREAHPHTAIGDSGNHRVE